MTQPSGAAHDLVRDLHARMARSIVGQDDLISRLIIGLLANGHILVEGLPGLAKTRAVKTLAANLHASFSRIQFTPDLLPSDITGTEIYYGTGGGHGEFHGEFRFQPGPVFANIVLADEINRAPAKVQAALLEAMEERQVTAAGRPHPLPRLFMVLATQNPIEHEGTYPLPEAQMDRFLMQVSVHYPSIGAELEILRLVRGEEGGGSASRADAQTRDSLPQEAVFMAREDVGKIHVSGAIERYIVDLVGATRQPGACPDIARWLQIGASPRGSLALDRCARAHAWLAGRDYVAPEDVRAIIHDALRHRLILSYEARAEGVGADRVIDLLVERVALP